MRKIPVLLMMLCLTIGLAACAGGSSESAGSSNSEGSDLSNVSSANDAGSAESSSAAGTEDQEESALEESGTLVVYFSATGTTRGVAEKIAAVEGADLYEIKPAQEYTDADLDWNDSDSRTTKEQNDPSARPEIGSDPASLDGYTTIFIGYPIWWGEEPRIMDAFVESYDFDGKTVIPFCTSGGSGIGSSGQNLAKNAGSGNWLEGERLEGSISEDELKSWIEGLQ